MFWLAMYIVGLTTVPMFHHRVLLLSAQCFCIKFVTITCKCWQLTPSTPPMCKLLNFPDSFSFYKRNSTLLGYHSHISDVKAIARQLLIPLVGAASGFFKEDEFHNLPRAWGIHLAHESFFKALRNGVDFLHGQPLDHLAHDGVLRPVYFVVTKLRSGLQHEVHCDFCVATFLSFVAHSLFFLKYSNLFLLNIFCFLQLSVHLFTVPLKFFFCHSSLSSVKCPFTYSSVSGLLLVFSWFQTAFRQVLSSSFPCLLPEYSPLDSCCTPCGSFFAQHDVHWSTHYFFFSLCFQSVHHFPGPRSRCFFFGIVARSSSVLSFFFPPLLF